ncbi:MAG: hypothetical protein Q4C73_04585 [Eubacteriales bacterium]|nr:hypothetical protein [Eubacteriales bacterium]
MEIYHQAQWLLLFFIYSMLGWVWESCYVSVQKRHWVNRGFLHGPWLPIYGSGALVVLVITLPVRGNLLLVFLFGIIGATLLEYVTGAAMERLFHMRYWDYSRWPMNINGYVCVPVSLAWGGFSVLMIRFLHPPIERLLLGIPLIAADAASLCLAVAFTVDVTRSVQDAMDLKVLIENLTAGNQRLGALEQRLKASLEQLNQNSEVFRQRLRQIEAAAAQNHELRAEERLQRREDRNEKILGALLEQRERASHTLSMLLEKCEAAIFTVSQELQASSSEQERTRLENMREMLLNLQDTIQNAQGRLSSRTAREFKRAVALLYRNPSASSRQYGDALKQLMSVRRDVAEKIREKRKNR